mmetsp:Transcript_15256/g.44101  ORF Transcript_15256/g.44101 Transcript_15256/m.44101 type:complete len:363 (-) Transcript_15256:1780-2868(-)
MTKIDEKTIPFLRRLLQMMKENENAMCFVPGNAKKNIAGRFVIHDRALVEAEILPKYFNHASFASLRRQLNYFHFVREGKGRMKGATYYHDAVWEIDDILQLRRRNEPVGAASATATTNKGPNKAPNKQPTSSNDKKVKAQPAASPVAEDEQNEAPPKPSATSSRRKRKKATSEPNEVDESPATESSSSANIISPSESLNDISTKATEVIAPAIIEGDVKATTEGSLASYKSIQTSNQNNKPTIVLDLTRPSEEDFTTPFYAHGYASFSQLQQQQQHQHQQQYSNEASYIQPLHHYQHNINHDAGTFAATEATTSQQESPHPITPPSQEDTTWEDELDLCSALLALQNCGPPPSKKPRQVSA